RPLASFRGNLKRSKINFRKAITQKNRGKFPKLIAEIKRASPSKGIITKRFDVAEIAKIYGNYASAVSVLTDRKFFRGDLKFIKIASKASGLPVLRKDFIIDEYQIYESRFYGADAILLISELLAKNKINEFIKISSSLGMDCLVEVASISSLKKVLETDAKIIGINNRDLRTLKVDTKKTPKLLKHIPKNKSKKLVFVSESGIYSRADVNDLKEKVDSVLIGSSIMESENRTTKLKELSGTPLVKICGVKSKKDALAAVKAGADFIGFNFYINSQRYIEPKKAAQIIRALPKKVVSVGVFVNESKSGVKRIAKISGVDLTQFSGDESPNFANSFKNGFKALKIRKRADLKEINKYKSGVILLEPFKKGLYGGTGKKFNARMLKGISKIHGKKIILAGGVGPSNVKGIMRFVSPYAFDTATGVESSPGKKSVAKMSKLIRMVNK
ncbi:MAG: bifunctional indole-3-glycerol phosphate synthase/phosphoribosylanthranilate isomerase, partial [Candidatus Diapherotrites archaeon]